MPGFTASGDTKGGSEMTEQQFNEISAWQKVTFGQATPLSKLAHLPSDIDV